MTDNNLIGYELISFNIYRAIKDGTDNMDLYIFNIITIRNQ